MNRHDGRHQPLVCQPQPQPQQQQIRRQRQNCSTHSTQAWLSFLLLLLLSPSFIIVTTTGLVSISQITAPSSFLLTSTNVRPGRNGRDDAFHHPSSGQGKGRRRHDWTILHATSDKRFSDNNNNNETDSNITPMDDIHGTTPPTPPQSVNVIKKNQKTRNFKPPSDNRDHLPFVVQVITPDPYTRPEFAKERARKNTEQDRQTKKANHNNNAATAGRRSGVIAPHITASLFETSSSSDAAAAATLLGEFILDQSTTCGDIVVVGEQSYLVQTAKCQYKYAGGKRFDMVRKVLHVKPIRRVQVEAVLQRSLQQSASLMNENGENESDEFLKLE